MKTLGDISLDRPLADVLLPVLESEVVLERLVDLICSRPELVDRLRDAVRES